MKWIITVLFAFTISVNAFAADEEYVGSDDGEDFDVSAEAVEAAKEAMLRLFTGKNSLDKRANVGITNCNTRWAQKLLGMPVPGDAPRGERGVRIGFSNEEALLNFAKSSLVFGSTYKYRDSENKVTEVQICAVLTGTVKPQRRKARD